jgi:hypothetical protein
MKFDFVFIMYLGATLSERMSTKIKSSDKYEKHQASDQQFYEQNIWKDCVFILCTASN